MEIRALRASDDRSPFQSGDEALDRFFHRYAGQNQFRHYIGVTYVAVDGRRILGFTTVATRPALLAIDARAERSVHNSRKAYTALERKLMRGAQAFARKNLVVDERDIRSLRRVLGVSTESEAVRIAVKERLALEEAQAALRRIRKRRGIADVFGRGGSLSRRAAR